MKVSFASEAVAAMRDAMDKALAVAPEAVRFTFLDEKYGTSAAAKAQAKRMAGYLHSARSQMRRVQAASMRDSETSIFVSQGQALHPDAFRTAYDSIMTGIDRNDTDTGWWLTIRKVDATSFGLEVVP